MKRKSRTTKNKDLRLGNLEARSGAALPESQLFSLLLSRWFEEVTAFPVETMVLGFGEEGDGGGQGGIKKPQRTATGKIVGEGCGSSVNCLIVINKSNGSKL
ncbi:hypothetical protein AAZX31_05G179400 [Glycine max]